ncbi:xanthine dehydrogenase accessory factor [Methylobacterium phyllostachyos]|uniref:Xanthine dehydrogenase accessory factor n=1 Tax=Methylobacterium phyllostachyos TaxID=582672 RepID=A0A1H0I6D3_9HYPH|nr:XdhC family protein [Methylobacterium phyllostachyos]SDO26982.1 xanthine dehydrogenase accessory factor [Methylobacterium phyllostachyos]
MRADLLTELNAERAARRAAILVTDIADGAQRLVKEAEIAVDPLGPVLGKHLASAKSGLVEVDGRTLFLTVHVPPVRLVVIGAVHISQAMAPMAAGLDLALSVIDPRTAFATPERFPGVELVAEWPDAVLGSRVPALDRYCALAALTHDPKIDDPALKAALAAGCFYVGALGSRKTHAARVARLTEAGFSPEQIGRIRAPIGLPIGAVSPAEIALAVLGEVVAALRRVPRPEAA